MHKITQGFKLNGSRELSYPVNALHRLRCCSRGTEHHNKSMGGVFLVSQLRKPVFLQFIERIQAKDHIRLSHEIALRLPTLTTTFSL